MTLRNPGVGALVLALALLTTACRGPEGTGAKSQAEELVLQGQRTYERHCAGCHGLEGKGDGPAAAFLNPPPRDFTEARFKFRTTPLTFLPTDQDLYRTITRGVHHTSMPSWRLLSDDERWALVGYLKTFAPERWADAEYQAPAMALPGAPSYFSEEPVSDPEFAEERKEDLEAARKAGGQVYVKAQCYSCHGTDGSLVGASNTDLRDYKDRPIVPLDFSKRTPKGGSQPEDYYRAFTTGLDGTPMPVYDTSLTVEERWQLVAFVMALREYGGLEKMPDELVPPELSQMHAKGGE